MRVTKRFNRNKNFDSVSEQEVIDDPSKKEDEFFYGTEKVALEIRAGESDIDSDNFPGRFKDCKEASGFFEIVRT